MFRFKMHTSIVFAGLLLGSTAALAAPEALSEALTRHLAEHGDLCLGKRDWPVDVSEIERRQGTRNALQMPVLEGLGLVSGADGHVNYRSEDGREQPVATRRYVLTELGQRYYLPRPVAAGRADAAQRADLCAGRVSLLAVQGVQPALESAPAKGTQVQVSYTYRFEAAPWATAPDARRVFPMVARVIDGAGQALLTQNFRWSGEQWRAVGAED